VVLVSDNRIFLYFLVKTGIQHLHYDVERTHNLVYSFDCVVGTNNNNNNNNNNTLIYIAPACRMTSEALAGTSQLASINKLTSKTISTSK